MVVDVLFHDMDTMNMSTNVDKTNIKMDFAFSGLF